jgi:uncharacterized protein YcbX
MPRVVALYRYPVKGFTPESCDSLTVLAEGRIEGDRALAFRFADSALPETAWSRKYGFAVLANTPGLARLCIHLDHDTRRLRVALGSDVLVEDALNDSGRKRIAEAVERYVLSLAENPLKGHPERSPLTLIGDGVTPRYQDSERGQSTLHSRESLASVASAVGDPDLSEARFRSNIVIEGIAAWEEQQWVGRKLRIGEVDFEVVRPKMRCLATHANPKTGERDLPMMPKLVQAFRQAEPTFAVGMTSRGGQVRVGDAVSVSTLDPE